MVSPLSVCGCSQNIGGNQNSCHVHPCIWKPSGHGGWKLEAARLIYMETPLNGKWCSSKNIYKILLPMCACNSFQPEAWYEKRPGLQDVHNTSNLKSWSGTYMSVRPLEWSTTTHDLVENSLDAKPPVAPCKATWLKTAKFDLEPCHWNVSSWNGTRGDAFLYSSRVRPPPGLSNAWLKAKAIHVLSWQGI